MQEEPEAPKETPLYSACVIVKPQVSGVPCVVKVKKSGDDDDEDEGGGQTVSTTIDKDIISQLKAAGYTIKRQVRRNLTKAEAVTIMGYLSTEAQFDEMTDAEVTAQLQEKEKDLRIAAIYGSWEWDGQFEGVAPVLQREDDGEGEEGEEGEEGLGRSDMVYPEFLISGERYLGTF